MEHLWILNLVIALVFIPMAVDEYQKKRWFVFIFDLIVIVINLGVVVTTPTN